MPARARSAAGCVSPPPAAEGRTVPRFLTTGLSLLRGIGYPWEWVRTAPRPARRLRFPRDGREGSREIAATGRFDPVEGWMAMSRENVLPPGEGRLLWSNPWPWLA